MFSENMSDGGSSGLISSTAMNAFSQQNVGRLDEEIKDIKTNITQIDQINHSLGVDLDIANKSVVEKQQELDRLKEEYNRSFLYITHDLATAYYVSDYLAVMYRGAIVEFGDAKTILGEPQHPYTQLLMASIPETTHKWTREEDVSMSDIETKEYQFEGCRFYNRCPLAEEICQQDRPAATHKEDGREVYCHFA